jgi:hypothetical protein
MLPVCFFGTLYRFFPEMLSLPVMRKTRPEACMSSSYRLSFFSLARFALIAATAWFAGVAVTPASAVEIGNDSFMLIFGDGWKDFTIGAPTAAATAIKGEFGEEGWVSLKLLKQAAALTPEELALYMKSYRQTDSVIVIDQGSKTLGDREFSFVEFEDGIRDDPSSEAPHFKLYYTAQSGYLFEAITYFTPSQNGGEVAEVESALATLNITAAAGLRRTRGMALTKPKAMDHDALGRFRPAAADGWIGFPARVAQH